MTTSRESRHEQVEHIRRLLREHEERRARRERAAFEDAVEQLLQRIATRPPIPPPPAPPRPDASDPAPDPRRSLPTYLPASPERASTSDRLDVWWSNAPVLGYRIWDLRGGRLHGAWTPWESSRKTAVCLDKHSRARGPVPHDASECRPPPCGIYALKGTRKIRRMVERSFQHTSVPVTFAIGLVAMTGRVIEHEHGYRAEHVEVVAMALVTGAHAKNTVLALVEDRESAAAAFIDPSAARSRIIPEPMSPQQAVGRAIAFLEEHQRAAA